MSNKLSVIQSATTAVSTEVRSYLSHGALQLPANYSVENALKSAMLSLPSTKNIQNCTQDSIKSSLLSMAVQGLNPDKKQCYFIAYGETLACQRSYLGDIAVAKQVDPEIEEIYAAAVYQGDEFSYEIKRGKIVSIHHSQKIENKNKPITAAYATVVYRDGSEISTVMTIDQIQQSWKQSSSKPFADNGQLKPDSVHAKFPEEMAKKTVTHKACKPIIGSSSDATLFGKFARETFDDVQVDAEIQENANQEYIDTDCVEVPEGVDPETGEYTEPKEEVEPF